MNSTETHSKKEIAISFLKTVVARKIDEAYDKSVDNKIIRLITY